MCACVRARARALKDGVVVGRYSSESSPYLTVPGRRAGGLVSVAQGRLLPRPVSPPPLLRCGLGSREAAGRRRGWLLRADPGRAGRAAKTATCRQSIENGQARGDRCFVRLGTHRGCPEVGDAFVQTAQTREADGERSRLLAIRFTRVGTGNSRCKRI